MNKKIGIFDSGIGGTTTLKEIMKLLPKEDYLYYADSKNNPYGNKSDKELFQITSDIVDYLISNDVKIIVIACNTATTKCIKELRKKYPKMLFVGTVPAIKVACDNNYNNTLVLATPGTISSDLTKELVEQNKKENENIFLLPCDGLANAIEKKNDKLIDDLLNKYLTPYKNKNIDAIVLGCTHYPLIKGKIQEFFKNAIILDGNIGVANRVKNLLEQNQLLNKKGTSNIKFIQTKKD